MTNRKGPGDAVIWWLRERCGKSEEVHSAMKSDLAGGQLPSGLFGANAAWWALTILAFNQLGLPSNIHLHLTPTPFPLDDHAFLLPAPLLRKSEYDDISAWMDAAVTPPGAMRIGLAHGSVVNFGSEGEATNPIDPARAAKAQLDYLALGDWHRTLQLGPAMWYAGTLEPDRRCRW